MKRPKTITINLETFCHSLASVGLVVRINEDGEIQLFPLFKRRKNPGPLVSFFPTRPRRKKGGRG